MKKSVSRLKICRQAALLCINSRNSNWILWRIRPERTFVASSWIINMPQALKPYPDIAALTSRTVIQFKAFQPSEAKHIKCKRDRRQQPTRPPERWAGHMMTHPDPPRLMVALPGTQERVLSSLNFFPNVNCVIHLDPDTQRSPSHSGNSKDPEHPHIRALLYLV